MAVVMENENSKKKTIEIDTEKVMKFVMVGVTGALAFIAFKQSRNVKILEDKIGLSLKELKNHGPIDISNSMVEKYTEKAVKKAADTAAERVADKMRDDASVIMAEKVKGVIQDQYSNIKDEVTREVKKQVSRISITSLKDEIKDEVKDAITDRLETQMDDILDSYNGQLNNIGKIYSSIAESMSKKE